MAEDSLDCEAEVSQLSVFLFTPVRFVVLLTVSVGASFSTASRFRVSQPPTEVQQALPFLRGAAVGQDNGSLTSNLYLPTDETPATQIRTADRHGIVTLPQDPPPRLHHIHPLLTR